jgi:hypothetical protein
LVFRYRSHSINETFINTPIGVDCIPLITKSYSSLYDFKNDNNKLEKNNKNGEELLKVISNLRNQLGILTLENKLLKAQNSLKD